MNQESPIPNFTALLSPTPRGARLARLLAATQLRDWGIPLEDAEHIVAELAANAASHGRVPGRDFRLTLYVVGATLRIEVTDTRGDCLPGVHPVAPDAESGRGLLLVDALADRWGVAEGPTPRKTVWAEITVPVREAPEPGRPRSGATGGLLQGKTRVKEPDQAPPLPPAAQTHPRG
ncbi:ATP-binding protein [Streptomyces broussonetiae]|uniref:ATP-binding protein n=1 Tax=Streptomyces broussonetiae TaxID=2686304 RepID=UPI001E42E5FF|nr:ATP-binding protein [Streptomyces broussonetiae]